jgi:hypothetical protein
MAKKLIFDGTSRDIPLKSLDVGDRYVSIDPRIEVENMGALGVPAYAYKNLPILRMTTEYMQGDKAIEKPVVLAKGTIVSLLTSQTVLLDATPTAAGAVSDDEGMVSPTASGTIPQYVKVSDGTIQTVNIDDSYYGYPEEVAALLVPANGGAEATYSYTALDTTNNPFHDLGDTDLSVGANIPVGIVMHDVYLDIRGAYLNLDYQDAVGVAHKGFITVPYADTDLVDNSIATGGATWAVEGYAAIWKKFQHLAFDGSQAPSGGLSGALVVSDSNGRFVPAAAAASVTQALTAQTVGKILVTDCRFPKELLEERRNYPGSSSTLLTPGSNTAGIPSDLYVFVRDVMTAVDTAPSKTDVKEAIRSGAFGYVRIQLSL